MPGMRFGSILTDWDARDQPAPGSYVNKYSFCFVGGGFQVLRQRVPFVEVRSISMAKITGSSVSGILF